MDVDRNNLSGQKYTNLY